MLSNQVRAKFALQIAPKIHSAPLGNDLGQFGKGGVGHKGPTPHTHVSRGPADLAFASLVLASESHQKAKLNMRVFAYLSKGGVWKGPYSKHKTTHEKR